MVMEWQTFPGSTHLANYCADSSSDCSLSILASTGHLVTASGNPQSLVLCILDVSVVCVAYVCTPNRCSIVDDRCPNCLVSHQ